MKFWSRLPVSFKCSESHMTHETAFLFWQKIWLTYSSKTIQNYLRYKIEFNFFDIFFLSQYPLLFVSCI